MHLIREMWLAEENHYFLMELVTLTRDWMGAVRKTHFRPITSASQKKRNAFWLTSYLCYWDRMVRSGHGCWVFCRVQSFCSLFMSCPLDISLKAQMLCSLLVLSLCYGILAKMSLFLDSDSGYHPCCVCCPILGCFTQSCSHVSLSLPLWKQALITHIGLVQNDFILADNIFSLCISSTVTLWSTGACVYHMMVVTPFYSQ